MKGWSSLMTSATVILSVLAVGLALILFAIKYQVQDLEEELAALNRDIVAEQRAQHVLEAEWSYLSDPERLRQLAARHLHLAPIAPDQLGSFALLPWSPDRFDQDGIDNAMFAQSGLGTVFGGIATQRMTFERAMQ